MFSHRFMKAIDTAHRAVPALAFATALVLPALGAPGPVRADHQPDHEPAARLEIVVKTITIHDDNDWGPRGAGEIRIGVNIFERGTQLAGTIMSFSANDGHTVPLYRAVPGAGDQVADPSIGPGIGFPVYAGGSYRFEFVGEEVDDWSKELLDDIRGVPQTSLGSFAVAMNEQNGWGPPGTYAKRGIARYCSSVGDYENNTCEVVPADFSVEYEIRRVALPDLRPTAIRVYDDTGEVCLVARNDGPRASEPFRMSLLLDGAPAPGGSMGPTTLAPGETNGVCQAVTLPTWGLHRLALVVDEERAVPEADEANNRLEQVLDRTLLGQSRPGDLPDEAAREADPAPPPGPGGTILATAPDGRPAGPRAEVLESPKGVDLQVIGVDVRAFNGERCFVGEGNEIWATIRNDGSVGAGELTVQVKLEDEPPTRRTIAGLAAHTERRELVSRGDPLKAGRQRVQVIADPDNQIVEGSEQNNAMRVEVDCRAG